MSSSSTSTTKTPLPAAERRASILRAATACFAERGFAGTTTASVAARAEVNETLVFRHFGSKQQLYLSSVDAAWERLQARCHVLFQAEPEARHWRMPGRAFIELVRAEPDVARMWMRGLVETTGTEAIDGHIAQRMQDVHGYVSDLVARSGRAGGLLAGRVAETEAWTIIALGLLGASLGTRGLVDDATFDEVIATHREWITGSAD